MLVAESQATSESSAKALALLAVGRYHSERREDAETAMHWYEEAIKLDPELADAALPLSDLYIGRERWEPAEQMLDVVIRSLKARVASEQDDALTRELCRQVYRMGYVQEKLGRRDRALAAYEEAYQLDATYLPALEGYGNLLVQSGRHDQALKVFQTILIHHREDLTDLEIVELYWQIGEVHIALKQHDRAQNHFEKALAIDPGHEPSLRALIQLADGAGGSIARPSTGRRWSGCWMETPRRRPRWSSARSPATDSGICTPPSTPTPRRCACAPARWR